MKFIFNLIFFSFTITAFSQGISSNKLISIISKADTVYFTADNSGCFHAYVLEVKMCKQKSGERKLIMKTDTGLVQKKLSAKNYSAFIKNYQASVNHFMKVEKQTCTSITEFDLMNKTANGRHNSSKFKNTSCEAEFNPELFLSQLLKK